MLTSTIKIKEIFLKDRVRVLLLGLLIVNFCFTLLVVFSNAPYGDGAVHTYLAKQMWRNRRVYSHYPHWMVNVVDGTFVYFPVAYPQLDFFRLAFAYSMLGENGVKLSNVVFGTLTVLVVFLLVKYIAGEKAAFLAAFFIAFDETLYSSTVASYMEITIILFSLTTLLFYVKFLEHRGNAELLLTSLFLGLCIATKQQGLLLYIGIVGFHFLYFLVLRTDGTNVPWEKEVESKSLLKLVALPLLFAAPFIAYQLATTGTLFYPPAPQFSRLIFKPKWTEDPVAFAYIENLVTPGMWTLDWLINRSAWFFFFYPGVLGFFGVALFIFGVIWILVKKRRIAALFSFIGLVHAIVFIWVNPLPRYYLILRLLVNIISGVGAYYVIQTLLYSNSFRAVAEKRLFKIFASKQTRRLIAVTFLLFFIAFPTYVRASAIYTEYHALSDRTSGGRWPNRVMKIQEAAEWLKANTLESDVILIGRLDEAILYLERNVMWISALGGRDIPKIFSSRNASEAWKYLQEYRVTYVWIDQLQFSSSSVDHIPERGLADYIDLSPFFVKVYQNDFVKIYRVSMWFNALSNLSKRHYYSNVLGDYDDIYQSSAITLTPQDTWLLNRTFRVGKPNSQGYVEIKVIPEELNVSDNFSKFPLTLVIYYSDAFKGSVDLSIRNSTLQDDWQKLAIVNGTESGELRNLTVPIERAYVSASKIILSFSIHGEAFPVRAILLFPGTLTLEKSDLNQMIEKLPSFKLNK